MSKSTSKPLDALRYSGPHPRLVEGAVLAVLGFVAVFAGIPVLLAVAGPLLKLTFTATAAVVLMCVVFPSGSTVKAIRALRARRARRRADVAPVDVTA